MSCTWSTTVLKHWRFPPKIPLQARGTRGLSSRAPILRTLTVDLGIKLPITSSPVTRPFVNP